MNMLTRYYVEFANGPCKGSYLYVYAKDKAAVVQMFLDYDLVLIDRTD